MGMVNAQMLHANTDIKTIMSQDPKRVRVASATRRMPIIPKTDHMRGLIGGKGAMDA